MGLTSLSDPSSYPPQINALLRHIMALSTDRVSRKSFKTNLEGYLEGSETGADSESGVALSDTTEGWADDR